MKITTTARHISGRFRAIIFMLVGIMTLSLSAPITATPVMAAGNGVYTKLVSLKTRYPENKFWNHKVTTKKNDGDSLKKYKDESFANSVTSTPCAVHGRSATIGQYDCNYFDGGLQCMGFAKKVFYDVFGQRESSLSAKYDTKNLRVGDYVRINKNTHSGVVLSISGNTFKLVECNFEGSGKKYNCQIRWGNVTYNKSCITYYKRATNYDKINTNFKVTMSWKNPELSLSTTNAVISVRPTANTTGRFTAAAGTLYSANGKRLASKSEKANTSGSNMKIWYDISKELGYKLSPGTTYLFRFTATFNGTDYTSGVYKFTTKKPTVAVSRISLNKSSVIVLKNRTYQLKATVYPSTATNKKITWKTSNSRIATVSSSGKVKAVKRGTCYITATSSNGKKYTCKIIVI